MTKAASHVIVQDLETADLRVSRERTKDDCMCAPRERTSLALVDLKLFFQGLSLHWRLRVGLQIW